MVRDEERLARIRGVLAENKWDALICALPSNVLMLSGYWPVIGSSIAIATRDGAVSLTVPQDERKLAEQGWADDIRTFEGASLNRLDSVAANACKSLCAPNDLFRFGSGDVLGFEGSASFDPSTYASTFIYGPALEHILSAAFPSAACVDATPALERLRSVLTTKELTRVRHACGIAQQAFLQIARLIKPDMREFEIATKLRREMFSDPADGERSGGFAYCMSGPNSAEAYKAYQRSGSREIAPGTFVLLHCNSYCNGFWTDITRTFCAGKPDSRITTIMDAVLEASRAAIAAVRPGVHASAVDHAARQVLADCGLGQYFVHAAGHGVGFAAINHNALPRIHPLSEDILEPGMVFNIEPAVYIEGYGGMRHCNMVAVSETGSELLTPFQDRSDELRLN